jgi:aminoglycoside phosphotransferase (APT) family kinase protein
LKIRECGFDTPLPIAYIEEFKHGLLYRSYYICKFCDYERSFREFTYYKESFDGKDDILTAFADFTAQLQNAGIYHKDYSPGNILFTKKNDRISFCIIDINRVKFGYVDEKAGYKNFERIWGGDAMLAVIAERYARNRGYDINKSIKKVVYYNRKVMTPPKDKSE